MFLKWVHPTYIDVLVFATMLNYLLDKGSIGSFNYSYDSTWAVKLEGESRGFAGREGGVIDDETLYLSLCAIVLKVCCF